MLYFSIRKYTKLYFTLMKYRIIKIYYTFIIKFAVLIGDFAEKKINIHDFFFLRWKFATIEKRKFWNDYSDNMIVVNFIPKTQNISGRKTRHQWRSLQWKYDGINIILLLLLNTFIYYLISLFLNNSKKKIKELSLIYIFIFECGHSQFKFFLINYKNR